MKILRVTYTVKSDFAGQNQNNIGTVMADLQKINNHGINYNCCLDADEKTFTHLAFFESDDDQKMLNGLPSFKNFQEELKAGGFEVPPKQELLTLVGSSINLFKN